MSAHSILVVTGIPVFSRERALSGVEFDDTLLSPLGLFPDARRAHAQSRPRPGTRAVRGED